MGFIHREAHSYRERCLAKEGLRGYYLRRLRDIGFNMSRVPLVLTEDREFVLAARRQKGSTICSQRCRRPRASPRPWLCHSRQAVRKDTWRAKSTSATRP
eukprot:6130996-Amphidinium_carterae.1